MIIYSLWFYEVDACHVTDFVAAFRESGIFYERLRRLPGHIHTDLLRGAEIEPGSCRLLSISFFTSIEDLLRAEHSAQMRALADWLRERTKQCIFLGTFSPFPWPEAGIPSAETLDRQRAEITPMEAHR